MAAVTARLIGGAEPLRLSRRQTHNQDGVQRGKKHLNWLDLDEAKPVIFSTNHVFKGSQVLEKKNLPPVLGSSCQILRSYLM